MKVCATRFNLYLALAVALALLCGCHPNKKKNEKTAAVRVHIEMSAGSLDSAKTISLLRSSPVLVTINNEPILTEANVLAARTIQSPGGYAVEIKFDETGTWILEQYTAGNPGRHLVIFGVWGSKDLDGRWLAAPLITHRLGNGLLSFTPDATPEETDEFVAGLNIFARNKYSKSLK